MIIYCSSCKVRRTLSQLFDENLLVCYKIPVFFPVFNGASLFRKLSEQNWVKFHARAEISALCCIVGLLSNLLWFNARLSDWLIINIDIHREPIKCDLPMAQKLGYTEELRAKLHSKSTKKKNVDLKKKSSYTAQVMLISDEFNGQPPLSGHLPSPQWWPLDGSSELIQLFTPFKNSVKKILLITRYFPA